MPMPDTKMTERPLLRGLDKYPRLLLVALLCAPPVTAGPLEEVIVTAQKREQSVFEVPASISVFSAADIQDSRLERFSD